MHSNLGQPFCVSNEHSSLWRIHDRNVHDCRKDIDTSTQRTRKLLIWATRQRHAAMLKSYFRLPPSSRDCAKTEISKNARRSDAGATGRLLAAVRQVRQVRHSRQGMTRLLSPFVYDHTMSSPCMYLAWQTKRQDHEERLRPHSNSTITALTQCP